MLLWLYTTHRQHVRIMHGIIIEQNCGKKKILLAGFFPFGLDFKNQFFIMVEN